MAWSGTGTDPVSIEKVDILFFVSFFGTYFYFLRYCIKIMWPA